MKSGIGPILRRFRNALKKRKDAAAWIAHEANPPRPDPLKDFRFFAVLGPWHESDVIGATVKNALTQGCEKVFVVDNDSPDDTVQCALAAGASLAATYTTAGFDHETKYRLMNDVVRQVSEETGEAHVWWLWIDADEFPHGPSGLTLRGYLAGLDRRFRIVGARNFNHYPDARPHYLPGFHPLDFQPLCEEFTAHEFRHCALGHWKHPLQRYDRGAPLIWAEPGFHRGVCDIVPLLEPVQPVFLHHFPYRGKAFTTERLRALCTKNNAGVVRNRQFEEEIGRPSGISKRFETLDFVYRREWDRVANLHVTGSPRGVDPQPWTRRVSAEDATFARWYSPEDLQLARTGGGPNPSPLQT